MSLVNYQKRKNIELFKNLEDSNFICKTQNYIPIYNRFFSLNDTNYNSINLNHKWYISEINDNYNYEQRLFNCKLKNINNNKLKEIDVFFKLAPLLDPFKYLIGKYDVTDKKLFSLPKLNSTNSECHPKFIDINNSAYIDGLFLYFTSILKNNHSFLHGVDYYGSFLGVKINFTINVYDDIDYLNTSDFFNKNKNILFKIDDYEHLFKNDTPKLQPIKIEHNISVKSQLSIKSFDNQIFEDVFDNSQNEYENEHKDNIELIDLTNDSLLDNNINNLTLKTNSTCSSRTSYTNEDYDNEDDNLSEINNHEEHNGSTKSDDNDNYEDDNYEDEEYDDDDDEEDDDEDEDDEDEDDEDEDDEEEEVINVTIPKFPVQVITMECCENTLDDLIINNELSKDEWFSALMQIIMILITYQKAFNFTHNDLHTNNVMYNQTNKTHLFYRYKKKVYKVPTFGRIFKIIDFGRSIYKFDGKVFCSDSFQMGGDAATQYNTEPYFNDKKPRLEPNPSFDLCRLACSIFDYVIDDIEEIKNFDNIRDPIKKLIYEWCLDDKGINMLYKNNGMERYPDFKLYKMIARCVHNHTPQAQLERDEFKKYLVNKYKEDNHHEIMDIDTIPCYI